MSSARQENKNDFKKRETEGSTQNLSDLTQRKSNAFLELCKKNSTTIFQNKTLPSQKGTDKSYCLIYSFLYPFVLL